MRFIATLEHTPDNCWAREEQAETAKDWIGSMDDRASEHDVELHGSYVTPNEHAFYVIMEADTFENVTSFLDSPFLEDHDGHIAPVMTGGRKRRSSRAEGSDGGQAPWAIETTHRGCGCEGRE